MLSRIALGIFLIIQLNQTFSLKIETTNFSKILTHTIKDSKIGFDWNITSKNEISLNKIECARIGKSSICNLNQELYDFNENSNLLSNNSCTFKLGDSGTTPLTSIRISQLSKNKIIYDVTYAYLDDWHLLQYIFSGKIQSRRKLQIVDMENCELLNDIDVRIEQTIDHLGDFLIRPDGSERFDIFYADTRLCHNTRTRITYDKDGNQIDGPTCILDSIKGVEIFEERNMEYKKFSIDKYFIIDKNNERCTGYLLDYSGDEIQELFDTKCHTRGNSSNLRVSIDHERVTYCHLQDNQNNVDCSIFNITSTKKINMKLTFPKNISELKVQNLENDDFLIFTALYDEEKIAKKHIEDIEVLYELRKFKSNGKQVGKTIKFQQSFEPSTEDFVAMEEISKNRYCFYFMSIYEKKCSEDNCAPNFKFDVKCLTIDSLM